MTDIFISKAGSTTKEARQMAEALRALGYSVWIDDDLPAHRAYSGVIEEHLRAAKAVVVIWSAEATKSQWVFSEANRGREDGKLVQLRLDDARLPMPFDTIQCADLTDWLGDLEAPGWRKVTDSIAALAGQADAPPAAADGLPNLASKPSIAVLPFENISNDPEQEYFVDGMVEEIISALSRFKSLHVVSAGSSTVIGGREMSPQEAARRLGVRYLLEGSVRKAGGRVRIAVHLSDADTGAQLWSERLDDTLDDVFALQDRVAERVAGVIETAVYDEDMRLAVKRPTTNLTSYDLYLRSLPLFRRSQKEEMVQSIALLDRAIELDPNYAMALSQASVCHRQMIDHGWCDDPEAHRSKGLDLAERALRLGLTDARVLSQIAASLPGLEGDQVRAIALVDRALAMNPASAFVWLISGSIRLRNGEPDLAAEHLETSIRLDPISTTANAFGRMYLASARFQQQRFDEALALFGTTSVRLPVSYAILASLHGHKGQIRQARESLAQFREHYAGTIDDVARIWFPQPQYSKLLLDGIALAEGRA